MATKSKLKESKQVYIKPHYRTMNLNEWGFVCTGCGKATSRKTYSNICPKYCNSCKHKKK